MYLISYIHDACLYSISKIHIITTESYINKTQGLNLAEILFPDIFSPHFPWSPVLSVWHKIKCPAEKNGLPRKLVFPSFIVTHWSLSLYLSRVDQIKKDYIDFLEEKTFKSFVILSFKKKKNLKSLCISIFSISVLPLRSYNKINGQGEKGSLILNLSETLTNPRRWGGTPLWSDRT